MISIWQRYLGLETSGSEEEVLIATQAVLAEIRQAERKLIEIGVPVELFAEAATQMRNAFSPTQLHASFSNHREAIIKRAVPLALQWASWSLIRFNENDIPEESIRSLQDSLAAQETILKETTLPASLREMLARQVAELKTALVLYKISGIQPLVDAVNKQSGELRHAPVEMVKEVNSGPPEAKSAVHNACRLLEQVAKVADEGSKVMKFGQELYALTTSSWQFGQQLLTSAQSIG